MHRVLLLLLVEPVVTLSSARTVAPRGGPLEAIGEGVVGSSTMGEGVVDVLPEPSVLGALFSGPVAFVVAVAAAAAVAVRVEPNPDARNYIWKANICGRMRPRIFKKNKVCGSARGAPEGCQSFSGFEVRR